MVIADEIAVSCDKETRTRSNPQRLVGIHSSAITAKAERVSVDQVWLRRARDKIDHLTREREDIRKALHTANERIKEHRRARNQPKPKAAMTFDAAFRQVAKERLPLDLYESLMEGASERLERAQSEHPDSSFGS